MRILFRIARLELASLFYSPIAWLILVVFAVQFGISFTDKIDMYVNYKALGYNTFNLSDYIFTNGQSPGLLLTVQSQLYLFVPLLTMGVLSREINSGSIKLLLSSPVSVFEIVMGKFLGIMLYGLVLVLILLAYVFTGYSQIEAFELTWMITGVFGLYLLLCAYASIGLFLSSLTSYQVVAAVSTLVVLTLLHYIGNVWQDVDFVRDITYFLSLSGKANSLIAGLIRSKDIIYFLVVIVLFLGLTMLKLWDGRQSLSASAKLLRYTAFVTSCIVVGYVGAIPKFTGYWDTTNQSIRTLTQESQDVVKALDTPLTITTYVNLLDKDYNIGARKQQNNDQSRFEQYQRFMPGLKMEYVYYYDTVENANLFANKVNAGLDMHQVAKNVAESHKIALSNFLTPDQIKEKIDLSGEGNRFVRILRSGSQETPLRLYNDFFKHPGEPNITAAIKRFVVKVPSIGFITGHQERGVDNFDDRGYRSATSDITHRTSLINNGFQIENIAIENEEIPAHIQALVLADPRASYSAEAIQKMINYIDQGGNLMITGEFSQKQFINPILEHLGISFKEGMLVEHHDGMSPEVLISYVSPQAASMGFGFKKYSTDPKFKVVMLGAGALSYQANPQMTDFEVNPLLVTKKEASWLRKYPLHPDSLSVSFQTNLGDVAGEMVTAYTLTRAKSNKTQKIVVISDADFISNLELSTFRKTNGKSNSEFYNELFKWYSDGVFPVEAARDITLDNDIRTSISGVKTIRIIFVYALPGLFLFGGILLLFWRKRK